MSNGQDAAINTGGSPSPDSGELVSTIDLAPPVEKAADTDPEAANKTGAQTSEQKTPEDGKSAEGKPAEDAGAEGDGKPSGEEDRFDKHPRFVELRTQLQESKKSYDTLQTRFTQLESQIAAGQQPSTGQQTQDGELPYRDVGKMTAEELNDWSSDDPHGYHANILAQAKFELGQEFGDKLDEQSYENAVVAELEAFAAEHPDFDEMWERHELQDFIAGHPGHNAVSAYYFLTSEKRGSDNQAAIDEAVKKAEQKFQDNLKAKNEARSLPAGVQRAGASVDTDEELKDSKKFGGTNRVLANRLTRLRQSRGMG